MYLQNYIYLIFIMNPFLTGLICSMLFLPSHHTKLPPVKDSYKLTFRIYKTSGTNYDDLQCSFIIYSKVDTGLNFPKSVQVSRLEWPQGDILLEVKKKTTKGYKPFAWTSSEGNFIPVITLYKIKDRDSVVVADNLNRYYNFSTGNYTARFWYHASKYNKMEDNFSNWVYFAVTDK